MDHSSTDVIASYCSSIQSRLPTFEKFSRTVDTGTDGGGGVRLYRSEGLVQWAVLGVLLSSSYTQTHFCYAPSGRILMVEDRERQFGVDEVTGEYVVDIEEIRSSGVRYYYLHGGEIAVDDMTGQAPPQRLTVGAAFKALGEYLVARDSVLSGWERLPQVLGTE